MKNWLSLIALSALSLACAAPVVSEPLLKVYKAQGTRQCESGGGTTVQMHQAELTRAGIPAQSPACGTDGQMRVALCGAPDGAIHIFTLPASRAAQAASLGFAPLADLPDARETPCR
jgi:hypothetical protein